jgi:hypothetical protein
MEHVLGTKNTGVLSIEAEHQTDAKFIQCFLRVRVGRVLILSQNLIVEHTDNLSGLDTDVELFLQVDIGLIDQE